MRPRWPDPVPLNTRGNVTLAVTVGFWKNPRESLDCDFVTVVVKNFRIPRKSHGTLELA